MNDKKKYWRNIIARFLAVGLMLLILAFNIAPVYAATWTVYFPISVTDTSGSARTNIPVLLGVTGSALQNGGFISATGTNTNCQLGATSIPFTMGTTQIGVFLSSMPAYSVQEVDLYSGYSPNQTAFPIILGNNGYFTTAASANFDLLGSGNYTWSGFFNPTSTGYALNSANACTVKGNGDGTITFSIYGDYNPTIASSSNGTGAATANLSVNLPSGYVAGDLVIISLCHYYSSPARTVTPPAGWTTVTDNVNSSMRVGFYYRVMDGTEGTHADFTASGAVTNYTYVANRIQTGTYNGNPVAGLAVIGATNLDAPNPPSLTPGFGVEDTLWLACVGAVNAQTTYSTGFTLTLGARATNSYSYTSYRSEAIATNDPDAWSTNSYWVANTIAIKGRSGVLYSVTSGVITAASHLIQCYISGGNIGIKVDGGAAVTAASDNIPASTGTMTWISSNIFAYCDYILAKVGSTETARWQPATMISGTTLVDLDSGDNNGTITWGTNSGLTISSGAVVSYSPTSSNASSSTGNFSPPTLTIGSNWYGTGNVASSGFWSIFSSMSTDAGFDGKTILMFVAIGVVMILGMLVFKSSGSVLISVVLIGGALYFFSEMSIIPFALVFVFLLISVGIMYLVRLI